MGISAFNSTPHSKMWWFLVLSTFLIPLLHRSSSFNSSLSPLILLDLLMYNSDFHGYVKDLEQRQIKQKKKWLSLYNFSLSDLKLHIFTSLHTLNKQRVCLLVCTNIYMLTHPNNSSVKTRMKSCSLPCTKTWPHAWHELND